MNRSEIVGGKIPVANSLIRKFTVALIGVDTNGLCAGTIIAPKIILTAAHCLQKTTKVRVIFGSNISKPSQMMVAEKQAINRVFETRKDDLAIADRGDIALVMLPQEIPSDYAPAPIAPKDYSPKEEELLLVAGYGKMESQDMQNLGELRYTGVRIFESSLGVSEFVTNQSNGSGVCFGDSGGPAFALIKGVLHIVGVASRVVNPDGDPCEGMAVYTNVGYLRPFIDHSSDILIQAEK